jgi:hypothetical protein
MKVPIKDRFADVISNPEESFWLPLYWGIGVDSNLRDMVKISPDQLHRLRAISARRRKEVDNTIVSTIASLPKSDQTNASLVFGLIQDINERAAIETRRQLEGVLSSSQLAICKKRTLPVVVWSYLCSQEGADALGLTRIQRAKLMQSDLEWKSRKFSLNQDFGERLLSVLSAEQRKRLRSLDEQGHVVGFDETPDLPIPLPLKDSVRRFGMTIDISHAHAVNPRKIELPGFDELGDDATRSALRVSAQQAKEMEELSSKVINVEVNDTTVSQVRDQVSKLLTPAQFATLKEIAFKNRLVDAAFPPAMIAAIGLHRSQVKKIKDIDHDLRLAIWSLRNETNDKLFEVLTPEQKRRLEKDCDRGRLFPIHSSGTIQGTAAPQG